MCLSLSIMFLRFVHVAYNGCPILFTAEEYSIAWMDHIFLLMDIWVVFIGLIWIKWLWTIMSRSFCGRTLSLPLGKPRSTWLGHRLGVWVFCFVLFLFGWFFGRAMRHAGSYFPDHGSNPCPPQWRHRVLTTGPPGKSPRCMFVRNCPKVSHGVLPFCIPISDAREF